jgi:hypothetical protein
MTGAKRQHYFFQLSIKKKCCQNQSQAINSGFRVLISKTNNSNSWGLKIEENFSSLVFSTVLIERKENHRTL